MSQTELIDLCGKVRDDLITESETERLEAILHEDPEARRFYLKFLQLDAMLEQVAPAAVAWEGLESIRFPSAFGSVTTGWIAVAAAVVLLGTGWLFRSLTNPANSGEPNQVATLVLAEECLWRSNSLLEGESLTTGALDLIEGTAVLRFGGGAEAVLTGPAALDLSSPSSASLRHGEVVVRAEEGAEGFRLTTPRGELIDLGTEFAVRVGDNGDTELHVHEGEVAVGEDFATQPEKIIREGVAVKLGQGSVGFDPVALDAPRFQELLARAGPKEQRDRMFAYEGFHTDPGVYAPAELDLGKGWDGAWRERKPSEIQGHLERAGDKMIVAHSQMDVTWPIKGGKAGMLEMPRGSSVWLRKMESPIRTGETSIRYFSFLVTEPDLDEARDRDGKLRWHALRFTLRSSEDYFGESLSFGWSRDQRPRVAVGFEATDRAMRRIPAGTVFCIAKILARKSGKDQVFFRFYTAEDELHLIEPADWDAQLADLDLSVEFDLLVLTSNAAETRYVDEIRIGPSWRSVTPVDTPALLSQSSN